MKDKLKYTIGRFLVILMPKKAEELHKNGMTILLDQKFSRLEHLMRNAILKKVDKDGEFDTLAEYHRSYWVNKGNDLFVLTDNMFDRFFLPDWSFIFNLLKEELEKEDEVFHTLVEIGTGNGNVLNYLSENFPNINKFVGIDLSAKQIDINKQKFVENSRLTFVEADGVEWVKANGKSNMVFVTSGGVLEYFTQESLEAFLKQLSDLGKIYFVAIEPIGIEINFEKNPNSQTYGQERSFSHNYKSLFAESSFSVWHQSKVEYENTDWYFTIIGAKS